MVADFAQHSSYDWKAGDSVGMVLALRRIMATLLVSATHQSVGRRSNVGMARMKYDVIGLQKPSKPGERA